LNYNLKHCLETLELDQNNMPFIKTLSVILTLKTYASKLFVKFIIEF